MIRKAIAGAVAAAAVAAPLALAAPAQGNSVGNGNPYDFDIVQTAIAATDADVALGTLDSYTAFFPNDRAFEVLAKSKGLLGPDHRFGATVDEGAIIKALVDGLGLATIEKVLLYHVVPNQVLPGSAVLAGSWIKSLTMANGQSLKVYVLSRSLPAIVLGDQDGRYLNDYVVKSKIDYVKTDTAVVHGISDVLLPKM